MPAFLAICIIVLLLDKQCIYRVSTSLLRQWIAARWNSLDPTPMPRMDFDTDTPNSATCSLVVTTFFAGACSLGANARWPTPTSLKLLLYTPKIISREKFIFCTYCATNSRSEE